MIHTGDVAVPYWGGLPVPALPDAFEDSHVIANLEGDLVEPDEAILTDPVVFNPLSILDYLDGLGVRVVALANNHILDVHESPRRTQDKLANHGIQSVGAGDNLEEARRCLKMNVEGHAVSFLAFGWEVIGCQVAKHMGPGVNPLEPRNVLESVQEVRGRFRDTTVILLMHWNYELERCPQPMHRKLAFRAIEAGADAVIGCHSHCVQGIEVHDGVPVVHRLSNWMLPQGVCWSGSLAFPDYASLELVFEWDLDTKDMVCHWFEYRRDGHQLIHIKSEHHKGSKRVQKLTPLQKFLPWRIRSLVS